MVSVNPETLVQQPAKCGVEIIKKPWFIAGAAVAGVSVIIIVITLPILLGPSVHVCRVNHGDVAIVLDESGSIEADDFVREKDFAVALAIKFYIEHDYIRVGVMTYSESSTIHQHVGAITTYDGMRDAMDQINQKKGGTNTAGAIDKVVSDMLVDPHIRLDTSRYCVLVTDGKSNDPQKTAEAAAKAKAEGIELFAIGVGANVDQTELEAIASQPEFVLHVDSFEGLDLIAEEVADLTCTHISYDQK